jgi:RNA polymerase sigma-B factor
MDGAPEEDAQLAVFREYFTNRDRRLRDQLVMDHDWIARRCAQRFVGRGEPFSDLIQVARIGVVKAVERFDPGRGHHFVSFAHPTVLGELRRHFRDTTWSVSVPRRYKDLTSQLTATRESLTQALGRPPRVDEVATAMDVDVDVVLETMEANQSYRTSSLDGSPVESSGTATSSLHHRMGADDPGLDTADLRISTIEALEALDARSRSIVVWRFYEGCTQSEIGARLGIGQVQVSRLLRTALGQLRGRLSDHDTQDTMVERRPPAEASDGEASRCEPAESSDSPAEPGAEPDT